MVRWIKRASVEMLIGAVAGFILWCIAGKSITSMMFGSLGGSFSCQGDVELGISKFLAMQLYSALGGALLSALVIELSRRAWQRRKARSAPTPVHSGVS